MKIEFKITRDGSHTLFIPEKDETYHSVHGAIQEAEHVFIEAGLRYFKNKSNIKVLEVGFGTGLNAILTYKYSENSKVNIEYTGVELYPLDQEVIEKLNYVNLIDGIDHEQYRSLHACEWGKVHKISTYFQLTKLHIPILKQKGEEMFDVVYFDAFGPNAQGEMWGKTVFELIFRLLKQGGHLVTYCAKGSVKRTIKEVGFVVESIPGPPGKREMTRALKL